MGCNVAGTVQPVRQYANATNNLGHWQRRRDHATGLPFWQWVAGGIGAAGAYGLRFFQMLQEAHDPYNTIQPVYQTSY